MEEKKGKVHDTYIQTHARRRLLARLDDEDNEDDNDDGW